MSRHIFIHGNGTINWASAFAPWLKESLENAGRKTVFETMPDSIIARQKYWMRYLYDFAKVKPEDTLIGWSSGAVCSLRYAEKNRIDKLVLIGCHYTDLDDDLEKQAGWFVEPWDWAAIKNNVNEAFVFHSDNDPYIPQEQFEFIGSQIGAKRIVIPGAGHFEESTSIPGLLEELGINRSLSL